MFHVSQIMGNNVLSVGVKTQTSFVKEDSRAGLLKFSFGLLAVVPKGKIKTIPDFPEAALQWNRKQIDIYLTVQLTPDLVVITSHI